MKKQLLRWPMAGKVAQTCALLFLCLSQLAQAQTFKPVSPFTDYPYPSFTPPPSSANSSNYSLQGQWGGSTSCWLLVSSWEGPGGAGFAWQAVDYASPTTIYDQGVVNYPAGVTDLNVGLIRDPMTAGMQIDVSYHKATVGHFVDVYNWRQPASLGGVFPFGAILAFNKQLSCITSYSRISMDTHIGYGTAIVWEDGTAGPSSGIRLIAANNNSFGPVFRCNGTFGQRRPDVAFTHGGSPTLDIHIAAYKASTNTIEEYHTPWQDIIPGGSAATICGAPPLCSNCALPMIPEDSNPVTGIPNSIHIDAPDHYSANNWAYTYEISGNIYARIMNYNPGSVPMPSYSGFPGTVCFTNGSYTPPIYPMPYTMPTINTAVNNLPVIAWDHDQSTGAASFYVAWHTAFVDPSYNPTSDAYIAIQVKENGFIANPLPGTPPTPYYFFGASQTAANISPTPTIALSKQNDAPWLYECYADLTTSGYQFRHRFIPFNVGSFKPGRVDEPKELEISINPNPFTDDLHIDFQHEIEAENVMVQINDMSGKVIGSYNNAIYGVNPFLSNAARSMVPGNYLINISCEKMKAQKTFKVTKTGQNMNVR